MKSKYETTQQSLEIFGCDEYDQLHVYCWEEHIIYLIDIQQWICLTMQMINKKQKLFLETEYYWVDDKIIFHGEEVDVIDVQDNEPEIGFIPIIMVDNHRVEVFSTYNKSSNIENIN